MEIQFYYQHNGCTPTQTKDSKIYNCLQLIQHTSVMTILPVTDDTINNLQTSFMKRLQCH